MKTGTRQLIQRLIDSGQALLESAGDPPLSHRKAFDSKVRTWTQAASEATKEIAVPDHKPGCYGHAVFERLDKIAGRVVLYPQPNGSPAQWAPASTDAATDEAFMQVCSDCHGSFETLNGIAHYCPWCGTEIDDPQWDVRRELVAP